MATNIDALLAEDAPKDIDALLADEAPAVPTSQKADLASLPWYSRASTGFMDPVYGSAQLMQNVTHDKAMNVLRKSAASVVGAIPGASREVVEDIARTRSDEDINRIVREREGEYLAERKAAGQEGLDWWRIGGTVANPMTWLGPTGVGAGAWAAVKAGAQTGIFQALLQPVTNDGNFIKDKSIQAAIGAGVGAAAGGTLHAALAGLKPVWRSAKEWSARIFSGTDDAAKQAAAATATDDALKAAGADPAKMDPNLYSAIRQEVGDALKAGIEPDPKIMTNRADALALPVPVQLTRGQASRDPMQFAWEINTSGVKGAGEPLTNRLGQQNRQLFENLNELGARNALEQFDASQKIIQHIEGVDAALKAKVDEAYKAVRDAAGRPARVSNEDFAQLSKNLLTDGKPELAALTSLADYLPENIARQYNDILSGKLPLTVDTVQFLDRAWGGVQRGAADDTAKKAIGALRTALNDAPVSDALGEASMAAYKAARALAKQRFALKDANPAYKAVIDDGVEPDKFFQKYVVKANVADLAGLKQLIGVENTTMLQQTLIGNMKRQALGSASEDNGTFLQSKFNSVLQDPVQAPRLRELFKGAPQTLDQLYRIGRVAEMIQRHPPASRVNTSNTASAAANLIRDVTLSEVGSALWNVVPAGALLSRSAGKVKEWASATKAVEEALTPGVTRKLEPAAPSTKVRRLSDLLAKAGAVGSMAATREEEE